MQNRLYKERMRGFNLLSMFLSKVECGGNTNSRNDGDFKEEYFVWLKEWGFNYVRIPMSYRLWTDPSDYYKIDEEVMKDIDKVVALGQKYGIHVALNFHRGPGYCINHGIDEEYDLFKDEFIQKVFAYHWEYFAKRYKGISSDELSFDLLNEPPSVGKDMTEEDYTKVMTMAIDAIRAVDPDRIIMVEGLGCGNIVAPQLVSTGVMQSCRGYSPFDISHYKCEWVKKPYPEKVTWPCYFSWTGQEPKEYWDKAKLHEFYKPWSELQDKGIRVICGECGAFKNTPHDVVLAWMEDVLTVLKEYDIGYALWEFDGTFGILDSERSDVDYEDFNGHKLDRKLLELLKKIG